jgi:hypothetical protein
MSLDPFARRFDLRRLPLEIGQKVTETSKPPNASQLSWRDDWTTDPTDRDFDAALEQVARERRCACPLCGAIVRSDGSVLR